MDLLYFVSAGIVNTTLDFSGNMMNCVMSVSVRIFFGCLKHIIV